jgi:hypothetical protein
MMGVDHDALTTRPAQPVDDVVQYRLLIETEQRFGCVLRIGQQARSQPG